MPQRFDIEQFTLSNCSARGTAANVMAGLTVIVIVDSEETYSGIGMLVEKRGHRVIEAAGEAQALAKVGEERPDLILMDTDLPAAKSLAVARGLRERARLQEASIVIVTSQKMPRLQEDSTSAAHNDYIVRQGDFEQLKNILNHLSTGAPSLVANEHVAK